MTTFHLIRHGAHGLLGRVLTGRMPGVALDARGRAQAAELAAALAARPIAAAMPAASSTRKPVRPCSTTSGKAPVRMATTGVPQAAASMATSELVSGTRLGTNRQRAPASSRRLRSKPSGPR